MSDGPFLPDFYYTPPPKDAAMFYCPYVPLTMSSASGGPIVTFTTRYEIYENAITVRGTVVRIKRITDSKLIELAEHIDLLTHIKHSNTDNKTILFRTTVEGLVYLKLKDIIR